MDHAELKQSIQSQFAALKSERIQPDTFWPVIARLLFSVRKDLTNSKTKTLGINYDLYDGSGQQAVRIWAAGIVANICPRGNTWFNLRYRNPKVNNRPGVPTFQKEGEDMFYSMLAASNWYEFAFEFFFEAAWACTAAGFKQRDDARKTVNYSLIPTGTYWISEDSWGRVNTLFRVYNASVAEVLDKWPDLDDAVKAKLGKNEFAKVEVLHAVRPRKGFDAEDKGNKNFEFESTYWLTTDMVLLEEGGFEDFPFLVHRVEREPGTPWGTGPGFRFIRDGQIQQNVAEDLLLADQKLLRPAMLVSDAMQDRNFDTHPDSIIWVPQSALTTPPKPLNEGIGRMVGVDREAKLRQAVEAAFSIPFFLMQNETTMTRAEFLGRQAQESAVLVPIYGRATSEVLDPMWPSLIKDAIEFDILPEVPESLQGESFDAGDIEYNSPFQTLQKRAHGLAGVESFLQVYSTLRTAMPEAGQKLAYGVDALKLLDQAAEANGVSTAMTDKDERKKSAELLQQAAVMQAQKEAMLQSMAIAQGAAPQAGGA